jgi:hypothetical protein
LKCYGGKPDLVKAIIEGTEVEGTPEEIARFLRAYHEHPSRPATTSATESSGKKEQIVSVGELVQYMKTKTDYAHTWDEIRDRFSIGGRLKSRGKGSDLYHRLYWRTQDARAKIEHEEGGKFSREDGVFKFKKA